jgi:uracil DNA glycosylase
VAKQQPVIWEEQGKGASFLRILKGVLKPPSLQGIRKEIENRGKEFTKNSILEIWTYKYIVKFIMFWGRLYGKLKKAFRHLYKYEFESL